MYPILFSIGKINFYSYGLFAAISVIAVYFVMKQLAFKKQLNDNNLFDKVLLVFVCALIFSRISYFVLYNNQFDAWYEIFYVWNGGLISFGGIIGGFIAFLIVFKKDLIKWLDVIGVSFLLGASIWRIGGFLSGGNPGMISNSFIAINNRIPTVLIESLILFFIFLYFYNNFTKMKFPNGVIFWICLGAYGFIRIGIDFLRDYSGQSVKVLNTGQIAGLLMFVISGFAILYLVLYDRYRKRK